MSGECASNQGGVALGSAKGEISLMQHNLLGAARIIKQLKSRKRSSLYI